MSGRTTIVITVLAGLLLANAAAAQVGPHAVINVSQSLLRIYNARDAEAFRELLAPSLQEKYSLEDLQLTLAHCHGLTHEIERFSLPSWGARRYGFFGVYAENSVLEMVLEIDENEKIIHWVITDNVTAKDHQCLLSRLP
ncbi:hypothetical protein [Microvirga terrestris]|uniref:DUF4019 domain-containing protein n=1 Tax=Microvirga terrestris TaxID=2791024 RepID=A0ABS0HVU9_9HYPH|nr:hypothetical protein [Microvirga terrestris]MBF9197605.1 hypothetical protein [Microvirga terrestris]